MNEGEVRQWLAVGEEGVLLQSALHRVSDLVELPAEALLPRDTDIKVEEALGEEGGNLLQLSQRIQAFSRRESSGFAALVQYRLSALKSIWRSREQWRSWERERDNGLPDDSSPAAAKRRANGGSGAATDGAASFSSKLSLMLIFPLIESQTRLDPSLCSLTTSILLQSLRECPPLSLRDQTDCLNGLESLLCTWLGEEPSGAVQPHTNIHSKEVTRDVASALVALACARNSAKTVLHTLYMLKQLTTLACLPVNDLIYILGALDGGPSVPAVPQGSRHVLSYGYDDPLCSGAEARDEAVSSDVTRRTATTDGTFLYVTSYAGQGLAKLGSGLQGTLRGYPYARNETLPRGFVAFADGVLLHRPTASDSGKQLLGSALDPATLHHLGDIPLPAELQMEDPVITLNIISNGMEFYWIRCINTNLEGCSISSPISYILLLDVFAVESTTLQVRVKRPRVVLTRRDDQQGTRTQGLEAVLRRNNPLRSSSTHGILEQAGQSAPPPPPPPPSGASPPTKDLSSTSVGLPFRSLASCPLLTCGNFITFLAHTAVNTSPGAQIARSLLSQVGTPRVVLAQCYSFSIRDGQFSSRQELSDSSYSGLGKGAPLSDTALSFDTFNNCIWSITSEYIDQFQNTGHLAPAHIARKLGFSETFSQPQIKDGNMASVEEIADTLTRHLGLLAAHSLAAAEQTGGATADQLILDTCHVARVLFLLEIAIKEKDGRTVCCLLTCLRMFLRSSSSWAGEGERTLLARIQETLWAIINQEGLSESIREEGCLTLVSAMPLLFPASQGRNEFLLSLLPATNPALLFLRDRILEKYTEELKSPFTTPQRRRQLTESSRLHSHLLQLAASQTAALLRRVTAAGSGSTTTASIGGSAATAASSGSVPTAATGRSAATTVNSDTTATAASSGSATTSAGSELACMLGEEPRLSTCVSYLAALTHHLLSLSVLSDDEDESHDLLFVFCNQVFEISGTLLEGVAMVAEGILSSNQGAEEQRCRLLLLEKIVKSSLLGVLLLPIVTCLSDNRLQGEDCEDFNIPALIGLVVKCYEVARITLQTKPNPASKPNPGLKATQAEGRCFLDGIKVPTPWASGRVVESPHPLKDNYKLKETVHIPGARCLYLKFDPKCATQYDYDKLTIHAGSTVSAKKVGEYGGNLHGFGSKTVLGAGWPKDMLRVEGDTVTLAFEMRSGREHNTPDRAIWGFKVGVRMQESEQTADTLPFMVDLAMSLTVLVVQNLGVLYQGKKLSREEEECHHLLSSKLLQKCSWEKSRKSSGLLCIEEESDIPRIKLSQDQIRRLRELSGLRIPYMRPSVRRVIDPETLEEAVLSAVIKHLAIGDTLRNLSVHEAECTLEYFTITDIIMETYQKLYALLRKLQKIAELENHLEAEVEDLREKRVKVSNLFFSHYGHEEASLKDLALLCFIKDVDFDERRPAAALEELQRCLETEADQPALAGAQSLAKTSQLVQAILQRVELLLRVSIDSLLSGSARNSNSSSSCHHHATSASSSVDAMSRSLQSWPSGMSKAMLKRSMSLEVDQQSLDDSILQIPKLRLKRTIRKMTGTKSSSLYRTSRMSGTASGLSRGSSDRPPQSAVLDQLFEFIGSHPEAAVSPWRFLEAVNIRRERSVARHYALLYMKQLLVAGGGSGNSSPPPHLVNSVAGLLRAGPRLGELTCSGSLLRKVRVAYSEVTALVVQAAGRQPVACSSAIGSLCTVPYQRSEEPCLVRSGLVSLLDRLCAARADITGDDVLKAEKYQLSTIAWTGFKVLANRCMDWEEEEEGECEDSRMILGLAHQVSILLTNHLARATGCTTTPGPVDQSSAENAPLQEILLLLNSMASSRLGRDILSQPACISKLLSLLLEPRLSPRMVLTLIQLCRVALPLMSSDGFSYVELPRWKLQGNLGPMGSPVDDHVAEEVGKDPPSVKIVRLLFAKLADFLIPGAHIAAVTTTATAASHLVKPEQVAEPDGSANHGLAGGAVEEDTVLPQGLPDMDRMLSLFIHKREDQPANEVIQQLLNASADMRLFQPSSVPNAAAGTSQNLDKIVSIDRDLTKAHRAEILTDDATVILRRAVKLAQQGFIVSIGTPQRLDELSEEKRMAVEQVARDRNAHLAKFDPARPFISSNVANSMAHELIELIHSLFGASTASTWESAIHGVIGQGLSDLQEISAASETLFTGSNCELFNIYNQGRQTLAVLTALGAYEVSLKPGLQVRISGLGMDESLATIVSISELTGQAVVRLCVPTDVSHFPRPANELQVPLSRLEIIRKSDPVQLFLSLSDEIIEAVQTLLIPDPTGTDPLTMALPAQGEGRSLKLATGRLVAEIRSRALQVLALFLQEPEFACRFMQKSCQAVDMLKCLSKDCLPSDRQVVVESATSRLRNLYRDCVKPPAPPSRRIGARHKVMVWDPSKTFPPLKSVLFTHNMLGITYYTEPVLGSGIPRGLMVYSNQMIPPSVNHFYWEVDILSLGDSADESGAPLISIGLAPLAEKKDNAWSNPIGTVFFHNNGRVVHYNGSSLLQWRSLRFDVQLNPGDTLGIGWEKLFDASANIPSSGTVYFTLNGVKLDQALEEVSGNMYPVVHIQKKNTRVKANFGSSKFAYSDGRVLQAAAAMSHQSEGNDTNEGFGSMPFQSDSDSSGSNSPDRGYALGAGHRRINTYSCRTALTPKALKEYVIGSSEDFRTGLSNEICAKTGPHIQCITLLDEDSDTDDEDEDGDFEDEIEHREDVNSLLVKAWETKVFPIIRRRFRNEAERKDGLEQIKGALSLGMADIARQTVEFLYEENGGIPRDLHLPTLDDVKAEMAKFSVDKLKRGQQVKIADQGNDGPHKKYFIPSMQKTFGLVGEVLEIDATYELIQVETYLKAEGLLVRFWYPVNVLEKPSECTVKRAVTGVQVVNINSAQVHKELLSWEFASTRIFCRKAYVQLIEQSRQAELPTYNLVEENSSMKTMISSNMLLLRDIDIENLQHLSNHLLATPFNGNMLECNINIADHQHVLNLENAKLSSLFYHDSDSLAYDLAEFLNRAASKGEDYVTELTTQICIALQLAPEFFCTEEILINDISTLKSCVQFPGVAFVAASVKVGKSVQDMKDLKDLTIQLQTLDGCFIKYNGQISSKDIVQYPKETNGFKDPLYSAFTPVVMATDKVRVSHSGGEEIGIKLYLHGIPQQFPVAALYIEQILLTVLSQEKSKLITSGILHQILEILSGLLMHYDMPQIIKERTFLLLAELLSCYDEKVRQQKQETHLPHLSVFTQMHGELKTLYEYETSRKCFRRFSTYLQALFELCTAITDLTGMQMTPSAKKSRSPTPSSASDREGSPAPTSVRRRFRPSGRRNRTPSAGSSSPLPESQPVSAAVTPEKHWFTKANLLANSMKFLVKRSQTMSGQTHDFFRDCYHNQSSPNDHSRLIILKGIPKHLEAKQIKSIITKALAPHGGLFKDDIFLQPTLDLEEEPPGEEGQETVTSGRKRTTSFIEPVRPSNSGLAVIQVRTMHKLDDAKMELERTPVLTQPGELDAADEFGTPGGLHIHKVTPSLHADDAALDSTLELYLKNKLFHQNCLRTEVLNGLEDLFISCYIASQRCCELEESDSSMESGITLKQSDVLLQDEGNLLYTFFYGIKQTRRGLVEGVKEIFQQYGSKLEHNTFKEINRYDNQTEFSDKTDSNSDTSIVSRVLQASREATDTLETPEHSSLPALRRPSAEGDECSLTLEGFLKFIDEYALQNIRAVWTGLQACGFDLQMERTYPMDWIQQQSLSSSWTMEMDEALVELGNSMGRQWQLSPLKITPGELYLTESQLASHEFRALQGLAPENLRSRYAVLVQLNQGLSSNLLALTDFRSALCYPGSIAAAISKGRRLLFYDMKECFLRKALDDTHQRNPDQPPPEVLIDPVEEIGNKNEDVCRCLFSQALNQLAGVPSEALNVSVAIGGDPQFPFNIKMAAGDEVHGNSGSFRHFLSGIVEQLHGPTLNLLVPYRGPGPFTGRYFLKPGPMNYGEEKMLQFLGQLLGISLRAAIPLPLDLMPSFWRSLVGQPLLAWDDQATAMDPVTAGYLTALEDVPTAEAFEAWLEEAGWPKLTYASLAGSYVELCQGGMSTPLTWDNRREYAERVRELRLREWEARERVTHIRAGLGTVAPLALILHTFSPEDLELRLCGQPYVDLKFLRSHTIYQVGISESDQHVGYFWSALESFSQEELGKFIKFACNQDRIPMVGDREWQQVPPYPMKIAPADRRECPADSQLIRVETCMFMIKLPRYTTYETMRARLLYAISCALDPLSG